MKRMICLFFAVCCLFSVIPLTYAEQAGHTAGNQWELLLRKEEADDDSFTVFCDVKNISGAPTAGTIIFAWYDNMGALFSMEHQEIDQAQTCSVSVPPVNQIQSATVKAFLWNSLNNMNALSHTAACSLTLQPALSNYDPTLDDFYERLDGSTVTEPLSNALIEKFSGSYAVADALANHNKTDAAIKNVIDGTKDLALVTYPSKENLDYAKSKGVDLAIVPIVNDAFVFLLNKDNPVSNLTQQQVRDIYSGKITNWSQLGGTAEDILPLQRNADSGSQSGMIAFMGDTPIQVPFEESHVIRAMGLLVERVTEEATAIGYSYYYYTTEMFLRDSIKLLSIDGVEPSNETIKNGTYPLITSYYAVFNKTQPQDSFARSVVQYLLSDEGQQLAEETGYVGLAPAQIKPLPNPVPGHPPNPAPERLFSLNDLYNKLIVHEEMAQWPKKITASVYNASIADVILSQQNTSNNMVKTIIEKTADLALCEYPSDEMLRYAEENNVQLEIVPLVKDAFVFIVNKDNNIDTLTTQQIKDVYAKTITNWRELGRNNDDKIRLLRDSLYPGTSRLYDFLGKDKITFDRPRWERINIDFAVDYMSRYNDGIVHSFLSRDGKNFKPLLIDGKTPGSDEYPMNITYYAVLRSTEEKDSFARKFLDALLSPEGQGAAQAFGYTTVD